MSFLSYQKKQTKKQLHAVSQNNHQPINISASQRAVYTSGCEPIGVGEKRSPSETRGSRIAAYCSPSETRGGLEMSTCARAGSCATLEGASSSVAGSTAAYGTPFSSDDKGTTCEPELLGDTTHQYLRRSYCCQRSHRSKNPRRLFFAVAYISRAVPSTAQKTTAQTTETRSEQTQNGAHMRRVARAAHRGEGRRQATRQLTPVQGICMRQAPSQSCVCDIRTCRVWLIAPVVVAILNSESPTSRHSQVTSSATCAISA